MMKDLQHQFSNYFVFLKTKKLFLHYQKTNTNNQFHEYLNPQRPVSSDAFKIHGYTDDFLSNKKTFSEIAQNFTNFIKDKKIIIHNAPFDLGFLDGELGLLKKEKMDRKSVIDSLEVARNKFPGTSNSLDALCKKFNIDLSRRTKHNALLDCELLRQVYINLVGEKEPSLQLKQAENLNENQNNIVKKY